MLKKRSVSDNLYSLLNSNLKILLKPNEEIYFPVESEIKFGTTIGIFLSILFNV